MTKTSSKSLTKAEWDAFFKHAKKIAEENKAYAEAHGMTMEELEGLRLEELKKSHGSDNGAAI